MTARDYFSTEYGQARDKFREAARAAGARLRRHRNPERGPQGEDLAADTARIGPAPAERVLVTISATHGVEGFCGSAVQVGTFAAGMAGELPDGVALLQIHAINPYGFAWLRRVTEDNVDLNRNFIDHGRPYPVNHGYEALHDVVCPAEWSDAIITESRKVLMAYAEAHGMQALQSAISAGQYSHADGIFFGGNANTWSRDTLLRILRTELKGARQVAVIDYHTGLGPRGHGERICSHRPGSDGYARAGQWYDDDITSPYLGSSSSVELFGVNLLGIEAALPEVDLTAIALEYGTVPTEQVKLAVMADNWLHAHGEPGSAKGRAIKAQIREAFYQDADDWKDMVWERAVDTQRKALKGLAEG